MLSPEQGWPSKALPGGEPHLEVLLRRKRSPAARRRSGREGGVAETALLMTSGCAPEVNDPWPGRSVGGWGDATPRGQAADPARESSRPGCCVAPRRASGGRSRISPARDRRRGARHGTCQGSREAPPGGAVGRHPARSRWVIPAPGARNHPPYDAPGAGRRGMLRFVWLTLRWCGGTARGRRWRRPCLRCLCCPRPWGRGCSRAPFRAPRPTGRSC